MPALKLDDRTIRSLTSNGKPREDYRDTLVPGLRLRVTEKGVKTWSLIFRIKGQPGQLRKTYGPYPRIDISAARDQARQDLNQAALGVDPRAPQQDPQLSVESVVESFQARHVAKLKSRKSIEGMLRRDILPVWAGRRIDTLRRRDVAAVLDRVMDRSGGGVLANHTLAVMSALFRFAMERGLLEYNPAAGMRRPGKVKVREAAVPFATLIEIWRAVEDERPAFAWYLRFRILTGKRESELMAMRWEDVGSEWWDLPAAFTKTERPDRVFVTPLFREGLRELHPISGGKPLVFGSDRYEGAYVALDPFVRRISRRVGVKFTGRDLRAAFVTCLSEMGTPPHVVAALASHALPGVTRKHYDRYGYDAEKRAALLAWDARLQVALGREIGGRVLPMHGALPRPASGE